MPTDEAIVSAQGARKPLEWSRQELEGRELALEWLETDGLGGFACGTVAGARTRRYHGWYVPAIPPPRRRWMLVSGCEEFVTAAGATTGISTQIYKSATNPDGSQNLTRFRLEPFPTWRHETEDFALERSLCMVRDRSVTIVRYVNRGARELTLRVRPLLAFRGSHRLQRENADWDPETEARGEVSLGAARCPTCPGSSCGPSSPRHGSTRSGTAISAIARKRTAGTTPRKTCGARSSGNGRCVPTRGRSCSSP